MKGNPNSQSQQWWIRLCFFWECLVTGVNLHLTLSEMRDGSQEHSYTGFYVNKLPATPNFLFEVKLPHPQPPALCSRAKLFSTQEWLLIGPGIGLSPEGCLSKIECKR